MVHSPKRPWLSLCLAWLFGLIVAAHSACTAPPRAPEDLESLLGYLFTHMDDDDPAQLVDGLEILHKYLQDDDKLQDAREGFTINNLDDEAVDQLDDVDRNASGLKGITVVTKSPNCVKDIAALLTWPDFKKILDNFDIYEREFDKDPECFSTRECLKIQANSRTRSKWAGVVEMEARYTIQYRWVDTQFGRMLLHRFWLKEKVDGDLFDVKLYDNYYIGVAMADGARETKPVSPAFRQAADGVIGRSGTDVEAIQELLGSAGTLRVHANWFRVSPGDIPLTEEQILDVLTQNQVTDATRHDTWLAEHPEQVSCTASDQESSDMAMGGMSMNTGGAQMPAGGMSEGRGGAAAPNGSTAGGQSSGGRPMDDAVSAGMAMTDVSGGTRPMAGTPSQPEGPNGGSPAGGMSEGRGGAAAPNGSTAGGQTSGGRPMDDDVSAGMAMTDVSGGTQPMAGTPSQPAGGQEGR